MSLIKQNMVANFAGTFWQALMSFLFVPIYIKLIGIESWGLIGVYSLFQTIFSLLDLGLSSTLSRELARLTIFKDQNTTVRNLVKTLEVVYWGIAIFIGILFISMSPYLANHWFKSNTLPVLVVLSSLFSMGIVMALQMPIGFYSGGMIGLQKQMKLNIINSSISTLRGLGAVFFLWLISPTVQAYFIWQIFASVLNIILLFISLKKALPFSPKKSTFQKKILIGIWKFAAGMSGIMFLSIILTQLDKFILSKLLSLEEFGYYTLASIVAMSLSKFTNPIMNAIYPRMTQLVEVNNQESLIELYHNNCQFIAVLLLPITMIITMFSKEILFIWTQNEITSNRTFLLVSILTLGSGFYTIMILPYTLQLAHGWTSLSIYKNIVAVIIMIPLIIYLTKNFGSIGAAFAWLTLNIGYIVFEIPLIHKRLLKTEKWKWYFNDFLTPFFISVIVAGTGKILIFSSLGKFGLLIYILLVFVLTLSITAFFTSFTRKSIINIIRNRVNFNF